MVRMTVSNVCVTCAHVFAYVRAHTSSAGLLPRKRAESDFTIASDQT